MEIKSNETIKQIKKRIDRKHSIPASSQRFMFNGMVLDDEKEAWNYGIRNGAVIYLSIALKK